MTSVVISISPSQSTTGNVTISLSVSGGVPTGGIMLLTTIPAGGLTNMSSFGQFSPSGAPSFQTGDTSFIFSANSAASYLGSTLGDDYDISFSWNDGNPNESNHVIWIYNTSGPVPPISNTCFPAKTPITTDQGVIAIQDLDKDVNTIRGNHIVAITKTVNPNKYLVCFEKDSLATNVPSKKTVMSKNHCVFYKGKMMPASWFLTGFDQVYKIKYTGEVLYNVLLDKHDKMIVNNLVCETLHPESKIAILYKILSFAKPEEQAKVIEQWNEYVINKNKIVSKNATK